MSVGESGSQGIVGEKVDEPPKTRFGCGSTCAGYQGHAERKRVGAPANDVGRHEVFPGLAAEPGIRALGLKYSSYNPTPLQGNVRTATTSNTTTAAAMRLTLPLLPLLIPPICFRFNYHNYYYNCYHYYCWCFFYHY